jgi:hypothetical protein
MKAMSGTLCILFLTAISLGDSYDSTITDIHSVYLASRL